MDLYRVEKDGVTFYVQPDKIGFYAASGYKVFRFVEQEVEDVGEEVRGYDNSHTATITGGAGNAQSI